MIKISTITINPKMKHVTKAAFIALLTASFIIILNYKTVKAADYSDDVDYYTVNDDSQYKDTTYDKEMAKLNSLPEHPNRNVGISDIKKYYAVNRQKTSIYALKPGTVYVMYETPNCVPLSGGYKLIRIEKTWERKRGGIFSLFDATITTAQYYDYAEDAMEMNTPIGGGFCRFFSLDKIKSPTDPSLENQMDII